MNQLYGNRRKIKLVRQRTQNTKLKLYTDKAKNKACKFEGSREKSLHKPELVGQSTHKKSKLNKTKKNKVLTNGLVKKYRGGGGWAGAERGRVMRF